MQAVTLPKLPVPPLEKTLEKYKKTMIPLLNEKQMEKLNNIVEKFGSPGGIGPRLQLYLIDRQKKLDNWVSSHYHSILHVGKYIYYVINIVL